MVGAMEIKSLRESTGCGMIDCRKALEYCEGNMDRAKLYLRIKGQAVCRYKYVDGERVTVGFSEHFANVCKQRGL